MSTPAIRQCNLVFHVRSIHTGSALCIGFTKETPSELPEGDVIHLCLLKKEDVEKQTNEKHCCPHQRISCTPNEAEQIGINLIRAATFYTAEVKKDE